MSLERAAHGAQVEELLEAHAASASVPSASAALAQASADALQAPAADGAPGGESGAAAATAAAVAAAVDEARRASGAEAGPSAPRGEAGGGGAPAPRGAGLAVAAIGPTVSLATYLEKRRAAVSAPDAFRIFCGALAMLAPLHARGVALRRVRPSLLRVTAAYAVVASAADAAPGEDALYASPEELLSGGGAATPKSDVYSLGVLFFELFNPVLGAEARARALGGLRHRILPAPLLAGRPLEAEFVQALLHPDPAARPSVAAIARSLAALHRSICAPPPPRPVRAAPPGDAAADAEVLLDFLRLMRRSKVVEGDRAVQQLRALEADIGAVAAQLDDVAREPPEALPEALLRAMAPPVRPPAPGSPAPRPRRVCVTILAEDVQLPA